MAGAALLVFATGAFADIKIGVLDLNKVLLESPQIADVKAQLKKQFDPREQEIVDLQKKMRADIGDYQKNSPTMKQDAKKAAEQKIMSQQQKLQDLQTKFQNDLTTAQNQAMQNVIKSLEAIVSKVAADQKLNLVLTKTSAAYSDPSFDVTDAVVKEIKKKK